MTRRSVLGTWLALASVAACSAAGAQSDGLNMRGDLEPWPKLQARVSLATHTPLMASLATPGGGSGLQGGRILGDYYFSTGSSRGTDYSGGFRATSGLLMTGGGVSLSQPSVPLGQGALSVSTLSLARPTEAGSALSHGAAYLGVGYTGLSPKGGWGFTADLGLLASSGGNGLRLRQPADETRLTPVLQLGVTYSF